MIVPHGGMIDRRCQLAAAICICLLTAPAISAADEAPLAIGQRIPVLRFKDLAGHDYAWSWPSTEAKLSLIFFWTPRSIPCIMEMISLDNIHEAMVGKGLRIIAVEAGGLDSSHIIIAMERYKRLYNYPSYPIVPDPQSALGGIFGVQKLPLPATFIVKEDGAIIYASKGSFREEDEPALRKFIENGLHGAALVEPPSRSQALTLEDMIDISIHARKGPFRIGDRVPAFTVRDANSENIRVPPTGGKATAVFFWVPRSAPCLEEMIFMNKLYTLAGANGFRVLAVEAGGLSPEKVSESLERYQRIYGKPLITVVPDQRERLSRFFGVQGLPMPMTFMLDGGGRIVAFTGYFTAQAGDALVERLEPLLEMEPGSLRAAMRR